MALRIQFSSRPLSCTTCITGTLASTWRPSTWRFKLDERTPVFSRSSSVFHFPAIFKAAIQPRPGKTVERETARVQVDKSSINQFIPCSRKDGGKLGFVRFECPDLDPMTITLSGCASRTYDDAKVPPGCGLTNRYTRAVPPGTILTRLHQNFLCFDLIHAVLMDV